MRSVFCALIRGYQILISPWLAPRCRYYPTCSQYAFEAVEVHDLAPGRREVLGVARVDAEPLTLAPVTIDRLVAEATIDRSTLRLASARYQIADGFGEVDGDAFWGEEAGDRQLDLKIRGRQIPLRSAAARVATRSATWKLGFSGVSSRSAGGVAMWMSALYAGGTVCTTMSMPGPVSRSCDGCSSSAVRPRVSR